MEWTGIADAARVLVICGEANRSLGPLLPGPRASFSSEGA